MVALLKMPMKIGPETGAERRMFPRKEIQARVEGKRMDHSISAHLQPHLSLSLRDLSFGGLSALSQTPLERGERLRVHQLRVLHQVGVKHPVDQLQVVDGVLVERVHPGSIGGRPLMWRPAPFAP